MDRDRMVDLGTATLPVAIVADKLWRQRQTGVGRSIQGLASGLVEHDASAIVVGFRERRSTSDERYGLPVYTIRASRRASAWLAHHDRGSNIEQYIAPEISVVHNCNIAMPVRTRCPSVVTVYDLSPIDLPSEYSERVGRMFRRSLQISQDRGDVALCISKATASRLVDALPDFRDRVVVGHLGPSLKLTPREQMNEIPKRILFVGEFTRRKRCDLVIRAFELAEFREDWRLTFAGNPGNAYKSLKDLIIESPCSDRIELLPSPKDEALASLYQSSAFLVLPSDMEGFGVPVLDAISMGLPVIVTDGSSLPEVAGPGGIVVPRGDADKLANAMRWLAEDAGVYDRLSTAGIQHAQQFSWWGHARAALEAYRQAVANAA